MSKRTYRNSKKEYYANQVYKNFFRQYLSLFHIEGISRQAQEFILTQLWYQTQVAAYQVPSTGTVIFTPFAPSWYNIYNYPTKCTLINTRGVSFIPTDIQDIYQGDDFKKPVVIAQFPALGSSVQSMDKLARYYANQIGDLLATYDTNQNLQKIPFIMKSDKQSNDSLSEVLGSVLSNREYVGTSIDTMGTIQALTTGAPYLLDKLRHEIEDWTGEFQAFLGVKHQNIEKRGNLVKHEAEAGDFETTLNGYLLRDSLEDFINNINYNFDVNLVLTYYPDMIAFSDGIEEKEDKNKKEVIDDE